MNIAITMLVALFPHIVKIRITETCIAKMIKMNRADPIASKMNRYVMHQTTSDDSPIVAITNLRASDDTDDTRQQITIIKMFSTVKIHRNV
jgi:hypothetical protein